MAEDGSSCFPPEVIKALEPEELGKRVKKYDTVEIQ